MRKKRIMFLSEWSELSSGYGVYYKNIISRLFNTGKYEILELANYAKEGDARLLNTPWEIIPVVPHDNDTEGMNRYNSNPLAQFGLFKFEEACIEFKPDIVISIFDYWYSSFVLKSPFRRFFKMIWMPTVDSKPQKPAWIDTYKLCDKVCAYSYFGKKTLEEESSGAIKDIDVCSPGIDNSYMPQASKEELRKMLGVPKDANIVMMVCRNQMRKLICDFIEAYGIFEAKYKKKNKKLVDNTYFYIHTSNPDSGWEIEKPISQLSNPNKIKLTYHCSNCGAISIESYIGIVATCKNCNKQSLLTTSVNKGVPRQAMADLMSIADIGVLTSIGEGFGMPIVEFKKVGVPVITVPWSAMEEQCVDIKCGENRHLGGIPVNIERMFTESATMQQRALFSRSDLAKKVFEHLSLNEGKKKLISDDAKRCVDTYFTWDGCAAKWENIIDKMDISDNADWIKDPPQFFENIEGKEIPQEVVYNIEESIRWCLKNWYNHPYFTEYRVQELINSLACGVEMIDQFNKTQFNYSKMKETFIAMISKNNIYENARYSRYNSGNTERQQETFNTIII